MAGINRLPDLSVSNDHGFVKKLLYCLAFSSLISFGVAAPADIDTIEASNNTLEERVPMWSFNCYSPGTACRGMGATSGGRQSIAGCSPIGGAGCSQFSFNGGGQFLLCVYSQANCAGAVLASVNGGSVTCLDAENFGGGGYAIGNVDEGC